MGSKVPYALKVYVERVQESVERTGYKVFHTTAYRTGAGLIAVKAAVREDNQEGINTNVSENPEMRETVRTALESQGYNVTGVKSSWFDWGGSGSDAVTFYIKP